MNTFPPNRHQQRRLRTRQQLLQATLELLLEKGYEALTVQDVTDQANLGRGTFYIHFQDKEDAVWTLIKEGLDQADQQAHQGTVTSQLEYYGYRNIFQHAAANRELYLTILGSQGSARLTDRITNYLVADFVREMQAFPIFQQSSDVPSEIVAQIISGAVMRLTFWWLETPNDYPPEQMAAMLYQVLHGSLKTLPVQNPPDETPGG